MEPEPKKKFGAGAEEKWLGSATLPLPLSRLSQLTLSSSLKMWTVSVLDEQARKLPQGEKDRLQHNFMWTLFSYQQSWPNRSGMLAQKEETAGLIRVECWPDRN